MNKCFPANLKHLYDMLDFVRLHAQNCGFEVAYINKIELATEEVLVNIINYGYPETEGAVEIQCSFSGQEGLKIVIKDGGIPYNPLKDKKTFNLQSALEERSVGGYGIFFILSLMDEVVYAREENFNVLTLKKHLTSQINPKNVS